MYVAKEEAIPEKTEGRIEISRASYVPEMGQKEKAGPRGGYGHVKRSLGPTWEVESERRRGVGEGRK